MLARVLLLLWVLLGHAWGDDPKWKVTSDPTWDACFQRSFGWNGADGAYSIDLGGGWSGWLFSDTFVGRVEEDGSRPADSLFLHNTWARIHRNRPSLAIFSSRPLVHGPEKNWFWVYQPWLNAQRQGYLFLGEFSTTPDGPEGLNFAQVGTSLVPLDWTRLQPRLGQPVAVPHYRGQPAPLNWGATLLEHGDWLYIYATRDFGTRKEVLVARSPARRPDDFGNWQFFDGQDWTSDVDLARPILGEASNEFSVYARGKEFRLLTQVGDEIRLYRGQRPEGPYLESVVLYKIGDTSTPGVLTYNAKAHPYTGDPMLITYNRNAFPPELVMKTADFYRPRCLRLHGDPWLP